MPTQQQQASPATRRPRFTTSLTPGALHVAMRVNVIALAMFACAAMPHAGSVLVAIVGVLLGCLLFAPAVTPVFVRRGTVLFWSRGRPRWLSEHDVLLGVGGVPPLNGSSMVARLVLLDRRTRRRFVISSAMASSEDSLVSRHLVPLAASLQPRSPSVLLVEGAYVPRPRRRRRLREFLVDAPTPSQPGEPAESSLRAVVVGRVDAGHVFEQMTRRRVFGFDVIDAATTLVRCDRAGQTDCVVVVRGTRSLSAWTVLV